MFPSYLTRGVAVEGKAVGGTAGQTGDDTSGSEGDDAVAQGLGTGEALKTSKVSSKTGDVGRSHGGARDGVLYADMSVQEASGVRRRREQLTVLLPIQVDRML